MQQGNQTNRGRTAQAQQTTKQPDKPTSKQPIKDTNTQMCVLDWLFARVFVGLFDLLLNPLVPSQPPSLFIPRSPPLSLALCSLSPRELHTATVQNISAREGENLTNCKLPGIHHFGWSGRPMEGAPKHVAAPIHPSPQIQRDMKPGFVPSTNLLQNVSLKCGSPPSLQIKGCPSSPDMLMRSCHNELPRCL